MISFRLSCKGFCSRKRSPVVLFSSETALAISSRDGFSWAAATRMLDGISNFAGAGGDTGLTATELAEFESSVVGLGEAGKLSREPSATEAGCAVLSSLASFAGRFAAKTKVEGFATAYR